MIKKLVYRFLRHRHFWREVGFDELSELYVGMMFRGMAVSMSGLFVPLYLLGLDYSVTQILLVMAWYFTFRSLVFDLMTAFVVARFGPKHGLVVSHVLLITSTGLFLTLPHFGWPIWLLGGLWGAAQSFFFISFNVDFSKVKHTEHGGKELGYITIMEKSGAVLGPLIGGLIATFIGPQYIFLVTIVLLLGGLVPLFRTAEPVRTRQHLNFRALKLSDHIRDFVSMGGMGIEHNISIFMWPLFMGLFILSATAGYAQLGVLISVSFLVSIFAARATGKLIDERKGRSLLRFSAIANSAIHLARPFIGTYPIAFGINILNDIVTPGYRMPYLKGWFDAADDLPGFRIVYLTSMEMFGSLIKALLCWSLVILSLYLMPHRVLTIGFVLAAGMSLLMTTERFRALDPKHTDG